MPLSPKLLRKSAAFDLAMALECCGVPLNAADANCNSDFFGSYENLQEQVEGKVVWPKLE